MKTLYVLVLILLASIVLVTGLTTFFANGETLILVLGVFNVMVSAGALMSYRGA